MKEAPKVGSRRLDLIDVDELVAALRNPKRHDLEGIAGSIKRWGFADSIVVDERTGRTISGHGRIEAIQAIRDDTQVEEVPDGIRIVGGAWCVPVIRGWASETDSDAEAFLLSTNRQGERGGWDQLLLAGVIGDLAEYDEELVRLAGWTEAEQLDVQAALEDVSGRHGQEPPDHWGDAGGIAPEYRCPSCQYEWNGEPRPPMP